jgi:tetratricopeptide (TPR) repeat protein
MGHNRYTRKNVPCLTMDDLLQVLAEKKNGRPNYGAILHYFRLLKGWTAAYLAFVYSEALGHEEIMTANWIYRMEHKNEVPTDEKRRWILARLLDIPPVLFGLEPLERAMSDLFTWEKVDVQEYRLTLENYCRYDVKQGWHAGSIVQVVSDIKLRISNLHNKAPYSSEKKEMRELLCGYFLLLGNIAHDYMELEAAIDYFNNAVNIAEEEKFYDLWAFALGQKGIAYRTRGDLTAGLKGYVGALADFKQAALSFQEAQQLAPKVQPVIRGLVAIRAGTAYASTAQDDDEFGEALKVIDAGGQEIGQRSDGHSLLLPALLNEELLSLDRAFAYLIYPARSVKHAMMAQKELERAAKKAINSPHRNTFGAMLLARSYLVAGQYNMAVAYTEAALDTIQTGQSDSNLARLNVIYHQLRNDPSYGKSTDVALLGTRLLKAQKPELFH